MAKKPSVRYWESRGGYGSWIDGTQHILAKGPDDGPRGPTYLEALQRFCKLLDLETNKGTDDYLVSALFNQYRAHLKERRNDVPHVFEMMVRAFSAGHGHLRVRDLRPFHVEDWLKEQSQWNDTSKNHAGRLILCAVSWARKKGYIQNDPLSKRVDLPRPVLRGREARISKELMDLLILQATEGNRLRSPQFPLLLRLLRATGARPSEVTRAEAHNLHRDRLVYRWNTKVGYVWKNAKKTQKDRVVFLPPDLAEVARAQAERFPSGPIFRTRHGRAWSKTNICEHMRRLLARGPVVDHCRSHGVDAGSVSLYSFRHSFISDWVDRAGDVYVCAQLCGTSVKMIETRYGHPDVDRLRERYLEFAAGR